MRQQTLLHLLGITRWRLRNQTTASDYGCYVLQGVNNHFSGLILADRGVQTAAWTDQEQLAEKIAKSITPKYSRVSFSEDLISDRLRCVILLGDSSKRLFLSTIKKSRVQCKIITAPSLTELMDNVDEKKKLWQILKPWAEYFNKVGGQHV